MRIRKKIIRSFCPYQSDNITTFTVQSRLCILQNFEWHQHKQRGGKQRTGQKVPIQIMYFVNWMFSWMIAGICGGSSVFCRWRLFSRLHFIFRANLCRGERCGHFDADDRHLSIRPPDTNISIAASQIDALFCPGLCTTAYVNICIALDSLSGWGISTG